LPHNLIKKLNTLLQPSLSYTTQKEFTYKKASFVTLWALELYVNVTPKQVTKSLMGTNPLAWLKKGYELMLEHRLLLEELARGSLALKTALSQTSGLPPSSTIFLLTNAVLKPNPT